MGHSAPWITAALSGAAARASVVAGMFRVAGLSTIPSLALAARRSALLLLLLFVLFEFGRVVFIEAILGMVHFWVAV